MDRRQGTLDQVFRARKRKLTSPVTSFSSKSKKYNYERASEEVVDISPPRKGNLEAFLFASKHEDPPREVEVSGSVPIAELPELRRAEVQFSSSKPWLTPCSLTSRPSTAEAIRDRIRDEGMGPVDTKDIGRRSTQSPLKTQLLQPLRSPVKTQILQSRTRGVSVDDRERECLRSAVDEGEAQNRTQTINGKIDGALPNQLSQFADEFLSLCFSGVNSSNYGTSHSGEPPALQQKRKDGLEPVNSAGRKKLCADLISADNREGLQDTDVPLSSTQHKDAVLDTVRCRVSGLVRDSISGHLEEQAGARELGTQLNTNLIRKGETHFEVGNKKPSEIAELSSDPEAVGVSLNKIRVHNLFLKGQHSLGGSHDIADNTRNHEAADLGPVDVKSDSGSDESNTKQLSTPPGVIPTQVRIAAESTREEKLNGNDAASGVSNVTLPSGDGQSKSSPGEAAISTPQPNNEDKLAPSLSHGKSEGGLYYRSSLFSPGDEFWEEAIELVMASKIDFHQSVIEKCNENGTPNKHSGSEVQRPKSAKGGLKYQGTAAQGSLPLKQGLQSQIAKRHSGDCNDNKGKPTSEHNCSLPRKPDVDLSVVGQEEVKSLRSQSRSSDSVQKTHRAGTGFGCWLKQFVSNPVSPLPVRRFDFSGKGENIDYTIPINQGQKKSENTQILNKQTLREDGVQEGDLALAGGEALQGKYPPQPALAPSSVVAETRALFKGTETATHALLSSSLETNAIKSAMPQESSIEATETLHTGAGRPDSSSKVILEQRSLELSSWIPMEISAVYAKKGLQKLYPWQLECLRLDGVLDGRNLVYSASTSAGKSLVAELLMIRRILSTGRMALLVLPFVSICSEKAEHLAAVLEPIGKRVRNFFGSQGSATVPKDTSVAVCTIEKANSLINKLLEENRLSEIGLIVIDELHMVGDRDRGYLLELLLTKIRYACGEIDNVRVLSQGKALASALTETVKNMESKADLQVIGMSATMPNIGAVAHWLQAALYETDFRPVPLEEFIKVGNMIYNRKMEISRIIRKGADFGGKDPDHVVELCHEVVKEGHSVLVFCSSRKACETTARHIAKYLPVDLSLRKEDANEWKDVADAVEELRKSSSGLDPVLEQTLPSGVAYHHAGLTVEEREIVEQCFKQGLVRVLTATSTLAAGVNLPARRVIFRQPKIGRDFLDGTRYRQMAGRAGRAGIDTKGESVLICKPEEVKKMVGVLTEGCKPLQSCLADDKIGMMRALLEVVAGGIVQTAQDVNRYVRCTLFNSTQSFDQVVKSVQDSLRWLCRKKFVEWNTETQVYTSTPLGRAAFGSSLSPDESLVVFEDLAKAREGFVLSSDLHLVYQVTPIYVELEPDWPLFYQKFVELSHLEQAVGSRVGVFESFLMRMAHGAPAASTSRSKGTARSPPKCTMTSPFRHGIVDGKFTGRHQAMDALRVCRRFYVALMLSNLVQEVPLMEVSDAFKVPRGTVQALQASAGRFAAMVSGFCERLGWQDLEGLVSKFQSRVSFGVRSEIVELTEIPFIKGARARALYKAGFRTIQAVAEATFPELVKALSEASPWAAQDDSRNNIQQKLLVGVVRKIKVGAQRIILERAEEARVSAFSAIQALGVVLPSTLWPSIPSNVAVTSVMAGEDAVDALYEPATTEDMPVVEQIQTRSDVCHNKPQLQDRATVAAVKHTASTAPGVDPMAVSNCIKIASLENRPDQNEKENQLKVGEVEGMSHDRRCNQSGTNGESVVQKYKKLASSTLNLSCLFGGSDFLKERSLEEDGSGRLDALEKANCGPIQVDKMLGGFESFLQQWMSIEEFYFDLNYRSQTTETSVQVFEIEGIAICWKDSPVYYVSLATSAFAASEKEVESGKLQDKNIGLVDSRENLRHTKIECENVLEVLNLVDIRWKKMSSVLSRIGSRKVSWNLKGQLRAFCYAGVLHASEKIDHMKNFSGHSFKENLNVLHELPPTVLGEPFVDVHVAAWLLWPDEESSHSRTLEQEVKKRLPGEVAASASRAGRWTNQMARVSHNGCCRRVAQIRALDSALWKLLISEGLHHPLLHIEMPMVKVLAEMESSGIGVDMEACCHIRHVIEQRIQGLEASAHQLAGIPFSLSIPADVANILYKHLQLPLPPGCKKGKQHPSTNKHALELLRHHHPIAAVIQEHRKLSKLLHSTLASIVVWSKPPVAIRAIDMKERVKRVHSIFGRWLQTSTATGRLSMEEPNLQCVENTICLSREGFVQDTDGLNRETVEINTRELFVPTQERWIMLSADYSQIEVRLMAHFSEDVALTQLLSKPSGDLFRMITAQWTGISEGAVSDKQREQTKKLVYGILYGMGVHALAEQLDCSVAEASLNLERFRSAFPGVHSWLQRACVNCRKRGYVMTLGGRKRFLEKINTGSHAEQARAERQAVNSICQGSAADLIKMAMIKLHTAIAGNVIEGNQSIAKGHCRLLLQIHDELVLEVDKLFLKEVSDVLRSCMEGAASLRVPLRVKLQVGKTWGSLTPLNDSSMKALPS